MFEGRRYTTKGVVETIPEELQLAMWSMIDGMEVRKKDYLQVFKLKSAVDSNRRVQHIRHIQEVPRYSREVTLETDSPVDAKVFVIDDGDHCTMLLAEEY